MNAHATEELDAALAASLAAEQQEARPRRPSLRTKLYWIAAGRAPPSSRPRGASTWMHPVDALAAERAMQRQKSFRLELSRRDRAMRSVVRRAALSK